jgi:hypothetical protein
VKNFGHQIQPPQRHPEQELGPTHDAIAIEMLRPLSVRSSWNRRTSSGVAVAGERFKYAANRSQLSMWLLCDAGPNLRAVMSSIIH